MLMSAGFRGAPPRRGAGWLGFAAALAGLAALAPAAAALQETPQTTHQVSAQADPCLNFRPSPDADSQPWDCLAPGTPLALLDSEGPWSRIRLEDGRVGWVATAYLGPIAAARPSPAPASPPLEPAPEAPGGLTLPPPSPSPAPDAAALQRLGADLELCRAERQDLLGRLETMTGERRAMEGRLSDLQAQRAELQAELAQSRNEKSRSRKADRAGTEELRRELAAAREATSVLQTRLEADRAEEGRLRAELEAARERESALQRRLGEGATSTSRLEAEVASLRAELSEVRRELESERALRGAARRETGGTEPQAVAASPATRVTVAPPVEAREPKVIAAEPVAGPSARVQVEVPLGTPPAEPMAPPEPLPALDRVTAMVEAWASAWSGQRVDEYLSFYASGFRPPAGLTRGEWEAQRRQRLTRPRFIEIDLAAIGQRPLGDAEVSVRFTQTYRSDTFSDVVLKTLLLVWEDGGWRILEETAEAVP